jgi:hypothetical protein
MELQPPYQITGKATLSDEVTIKYVCPPMVIQLKRTPWIFRPFVFLWRIFFPIIKKNEVITFPDGATGHVTKRKGNTITVLGHVLEPGEEIKVGFNATTHKWEEPEHTNRVHGVPPKRWTQEDIDKYIPGTDPYVL